MAAPSYIVEFVSQGRYVKVTAVDPVSGLEATIVGDARENPKILERHALKKLDYLMQKGSSQ
jgi:hypothetical protein